MRPYVASADENLLASLAVLATEVKIESHKWIVSIVDDCEDSASETLVVRVHNLPSAYEFYENLKYPVMLEDLVRSHGVITITRFFWFLVLVLIDL